MARLGRATPRRITQPRAPRTIVLPCSGSVTPNGSNKPTTIVLAARTGSVTPAGSVAGKTIVKTALIGSVTASGAVAPLKVSLLPARTGSITPSGALGARTVTRQLAGSVTPAGAIVGKTVTKATALTGSVTAAGTMTPARIVNKPLSGSVTATGQIVGKTVTRRLGGSVTPSGALAPKTTRRLLTAALAPSGAVFPLRLPAAGSWLSPPKALDESPVLGSIVTWDQDVPAGATLRVQSSVDTTATWQDITNGGEIPRLIGGTTTVRAVFLRVLFTRPTGADPTATINRLRVLIQQNHSTIEWMPLGQFTPVDVDVNESATGVVINIAAPDITQLISDNAWRSVKSFQKGTNLGDVLRAVITDRYPAAQFDFETTNATAPATLTFGANAQNDPWEDCLRVAVACEGKELYQDWRGIFVLRTPVDPETAPPVWAFSGRDNPRMTELTRHLTKTGSANVVVVEGESTGNAGATAVRAEVVDNDPTSPNNVDGPEGPKVYRTTTKLAVDNQAAMAIAKGIAMQRKGALETVEFLTVPVGHLEESDVVTVTKETIGLSGNHLIDRMTIPLDAETEMRIAARRRRLDESTPGGSVGGLDGEETGGGGNTGGGGLRTYSTPGECLKIGTNGNLNHYKVQTGKPGGGSIIEKSQTSIGGGFTQTPQFCMTADKTAVQMRASYDMPTTSGSDNPRTELREEDSNGTGETGWNPSAGPHWQQLTWRFTHLPSAFGSSTAQQIHDTDDDVLQILTLKVSGVLKWGYRKNGGAFVAIGNYTIGDWITSRIEYSGSTGKIYWVAGTDATAVPTSAQVSFSLTHSGNCYFKAGTYAQRHDDESGADYAVGEYKKLGTKHPGGPDPVFDTDELPSTGDTDSFSVAFGACINASGSDAFTHIKDLHPDWWVILGDVWYKDGNTPNWVSDWTTKFAESRYAALLADLPNPQVVGWSDHDFGYANNATGSDNATLTNNANAAYRTKFGTSPGGIPLPAKGIYRSWVVGRVRFILLDCMTFKSTLGSANSSSRTMLGSTQKSWYKNLLATANEPLIVVFGDGQLPGPAEDGQDEWRGYAHERAELATAVGNSAATVVYCNGDTHSLAVGHDQYGYKRCWQSAPLHNNTKVKAGGEGYDFTYPSNDGEGPVKELYAVLNFVDSGGKITVTARGYEGATEIGSGDVLEVVAA